MGEASVNVPRPAGEYKTAMTETPAWPDADEDSHSRRANELSQTKTDVVRVLTAWLLGRSSVSDGQTWLGRSSDAGRTAVRSGNDFDGDIGLHVLDVGGVPNWCVNSTISVLGSGWTFVGKLRRVNSGICGGTRMGWPTGRLVT